jgi:hypothetical protein
MLTLSTTFLNMIVILLALIRFSITIPVLIVSTLFALLLIILIKGFVKIWWPVYFRSCIFVFLYNIVLIPSLKGSINLPILTWFQITVLTFCAYIYSEQLTGAKIKRLLVSSKDADGGLMQLFRTVRRYIKTLLYLDVVLRLRLRKLLRLRDQNIRGRIRVSNRRRPTISKNK